MTLPRTGCFQNRQSRAPMSRWLVRHAPPDTLHPANAGRVRDAHQVGGPPEEVFGLDEMVSRIDFMKMLTNIIRRSH